MVRTWTRPRAGANLDRLDTGRSQSAGTELEIPLVEQGCRLEAARESLRPRCADGALILNGRLELIPGAGAAVGVLGIDNDGGLGGEETLLLLLSETPAFLAGRALHLPRSWGRRAGISRGRRGGGGTPPCTGRRSVPGRRRRRRGRRRWCGRATRQAARHMSGRRGREHQARRPHAAVQGLKASRRWPSLGLGNRVVIERELIRK